jgi:hypothetical protein
MTFELTQPTTLRLKHAAARKEFHGEALVLALDLRCIWTTNNKSLELLSKDVREGLFTALPSSMERDEDDDQDELDLPVSDLPFVRMPKLKYPVKIENEMTGYTLRQDFGLGGKSDAVLSVCVLKNWGITPIEGGSVDIEFTISSAADITGEIVGRFMALIQQDIVITLLAPAMVEDGVIDVSAGSGAPGTGPVDEPAPKTKPKSKAHRDATAAFLDANGTTQAH